MSVTITINNNFEYCTANNLVKVTPLDPSDDYDRELISEGVTERRSYPFELNLANGNFADLWEALGLEHDYCGTVDAHEFAGRLNNLKGNLRGLISDSNEDTQEGRCTIISCGRTLERVSRYYWELSKITTEALLRNEAITWS